MINHKGVCRTAPATPGLSNIAASKELGEDLVSSIKSMKPHWRPSRCQRPDNGCQETDNVQGMAGGGSGLPGIAITPGKGRVAQFSIFKPCVQLLLATVKLDFRLFVS